MFGNRLTLFDLFGFKVRVDASWLVLAALIVWSLAAGYFPYAAPGYEPFAYWGMGLVGLAGLALSIIVHELAHALVARRQGMPISGITLFVFGGVAEMEDEPPTPKGEFLMAIAGPMMSLAVAALCYGLAAGLAGRLGAGPGNGAVVVLAYLGMLNMMLMAFNLIPAFPLDGGRVLRAALWAWKGDILWATLMAARSGFVLGIGLMAWGAYAVFQGALVPGLWWCVIGLFVRMAASQAYRQQVQRTGLAERSVARLMTPDPLWVPPSLSLERLAEEVMWGRAYKCLPVVEDGRLAGVVTLDSLHRVPRADWSRRTVAELMEPLGLQAITETASAAEALVRMRRIGRSPLMVTRGGRLVGVLGVSDLIPHLALRMDFGEGATPFAPRIRPGP